MSGYALDGAGFGQARPPEVYLGGDPTGRVYGIVWQSWGGPQAKGTGQGWRVPPGQPVGDGSPAPLAIVAFNLGTCDGHPAYQTVEWFVPGQGQFDPGIDSNLCTADGRRTGKDTDTAELAARCLLGAYLRSDVTRASPCAGSLATARSLFLSLSGYDRTVLGNYASDFTGCVPAPVTHYGGQEVPAGTRLNCTFGNGPNDNPAGVWIVVTAAGPPYLAVNIGPD